MIDDDAAASVRSEIQTLEIFGRNTGKAQGRVGLEPEPAVIAGIAENDTSGRAEGSYPVKSSAYEANAHPLPLAVGSPLSISVPCD